MYADLLDKGYACLRRGDPDAALIRFQNAAELEPDLPQAYFGLAMAHLDLANADEVMHFLEKALQVDAAYIPARAFLGIEYLKRYDLERAQQELDQALRDEPTNLLAHIKYAEYYFRLGFYNRSVELLERGLKGPHGANEHIVNMARQFLIQARQKNKSIILREPPDPRRLLTLFARFLPKGRSKAQASGKVS